MKTVTEAVRELGGVWPNKGGGSVVIVGWYGSTTDRPADFIVWNKGGYCLEITRTQFESEAERLRNKPKWADLPEWVKYIYQRGDSSGTWMGFEFKPEPSRDLKYYLLSTGGRVARLQKGEILGDWRNTLEQRPDQKQGTDWHQRGELPPVGTVCDGYVQDSARTWRWLEVEILKHHNIPQNECAVHVTKHAILRWCDQFRPLRTDRDLWIDEALRATDYKTTRKDMANIYAAMLDGTLPTPGGKQ